MFRRSIGSEKLGFKVERVVLECDGTDIDDDDELIALQGSIVIGLKEGEVWCPVETPNLPVSEAVSPASVTVSSAVPMEMIPSTCKLYSLKVTCEFAVHNM